MNIYKKLIIVLFFASLFEFARAQENSIIFNHDQSGNLVQRKIQVMAGGRIGNFNSPKDSLQLDFSVFPNPTNQNINVEGPLPENFASGDLILMNVNGQILKKTSYTGQPKSLTISDLKPGLYLLEIWYSKEKKSTYKIIVTN